MTKPIGYYVSDQSDTEAMIDLLVAVAEQIRYPVEIYQ